MSSAPSGQGNSGQDGRIIAGAAVVGGVAATLLVGPVVGIVAAGGAAYAATRSDKVGEVAKSTGQAAVAVGGKAAALDKEHGITNKIGDGLKTGVKAAQGFDQKHDVSGKVAGGISWAMKGITSAMGSGSDRSGAQPPPAAGHQGYGTSDQARR